MTEHERYRRLESLFHQLFDLPDAQRLAHIEALVGEDKHLATELHAMFAQENVAGEDVLENLAQHAKSLTRAPDMPAHIGPYRVLRVLGEGGMGRVFEAEQETPVRRQVAIKLTHSGLRNERAIARFHGERQALAVLEHPNIARIYDVGTHHDGRPWFAMELVDGVSITQWVNTRDLDLRARLELLLPVCEAVQHAHRKGIIHRDLKPSNILVAEQEGKGIPKIIDFGVAKALHPTLEEMDKTRDGDLIGTPEYMSPEQASFGAIDIDTRSDVYALGLILFELLSGQLPMTLNDLRRLAFDEMCRRIREDDPPKPSTVLHLTNPMRGSMSSAEWARRLQGDLDAVVMKALAKDRDQRYESVADLADDLRRYLADQPVQATPPNWPHRMRKWIKRNRALSIAASIAALAIFVAGTWVIRSNIEVRKALLNTTVAQQESEAINAFLLSLFKAADPRKEPGKNPTARDLLARGLGKLNTDSELPPSVRLQLLESLGEVSWSLGDYEKAHDLLSEALLAHTPPMSSMKSIYPERHANVLDRLGAIARDRGDLEKSAQLHRSALELLSQHQLHRTARAGRATNNLAMVLRRQGKLHEAAALYNEALQMQNGNNDVSQEHLASTALNLAAVHHELGDFDAAIKSQQNALHLFQQFLPPEHPNFAVIYNNMSMTHRNIGLLHEGLNLIKQAQANENLNLPVNHPDRADSLHNEAAILIRLGRLDEAKSRLDTAKKLLTEALSPDSPRLYVHTDSLAEIMFLHGQYDNAVHEWRALLQAIPAKPDTLKQRMVSTRKLAMAHRGAKQWPDAITAASSYLKLAHDAKRTNDIGLGHLLLAMIALDQNQNEQGQKHFANAMQVLPDCAEGSCALDQGATHLLRAHYLARFGQNAEAISALHKSIDHRFWGYSILTHADLKSLHTHSQWAVLQVKLRERLISSVAKSS